MSYFFRSGCLFISILIACQSNGQSVGNRIAEANLAFNHFRLEESRRLLNSVINDPASKVMDKVAALQTAAQQDWKFYGNFRLAERELKKAITFNRETCRSLIILSTLSRDAGYFDLAKTQALLAISAHRNESEALEAQLAFAYSVLDQNIAFVEAGRPLNRAELEHASMLLSGILNKQPGRPEPAEKLIGVSLLLEDGEGLFNAWKSYYFISEGKTVNTILKTPYQHFLRLLPSWKQSKLSVADEKTLVMSLSESRFNDYACLAANFLFTADSTTLLGDKDVHTIFSYQQLIEHIQAVNQRFYPVAARGRKHYDTAYDAAIDTGCKSLWIALDPSNTRNNYNLDSLFSILKTRFGTDGYMGNTVGYYGLLLGHIIGYERKEIEQYGYKASFNYELIDRMISLDFTTWYGATNVGGWGDSSTIYQVRKAYLTDPFERLSWMIDSTAERKLLAKIETDRKNDIVRCQKDPYADPGFLALLLKYNASKKIMDSLRSTGLQHSELYAAFILETLRLNVEATVFCHEGRHAIDQLFFKKEFDSMPDDERELRAKFSEVRFSSNPKLAFTGSIFGGDLDSNTNHGRANQRFRKIIVDWMKMHATDIPGIDRSLPLMIQFDLLTNDQIINICESADPLSPRYIPHRP